MKKHVSFDKNTEAKEMIPMKIAICDDSEAFLVLLSKEINNCCALRDWPCEITCYSDPMKMLNDNNEYEVVFLDIDMPEIDGINLAQKLRDRSAETVIVFITGFLEYAPQGYTVNAFRYLLKKDLQDNLMKCMKEIWEKLYIKQESISVTTETGANRIRLKDIKYIEGTSRRHVRLHVVNSKEGVVECIGNLSNFQTVLESKGFLRIQKSFIVNMKHVKDIRNYNAIMDCGDILRVSRNNYANIVKDFMLWTGEQI